MNVCECGVPGKVEEIGRLFENRGLNVLALSETILIGDIWDRKR